jgi:hypothetical protein
MSTLTLVDFLRARLDEDEAVARAATSGPWSAVEGSSGAWWVELPNLGDVALDLHGENARHIARHDPARVLADVKAKRAIVGLGICLACDVEGQPCDHADETLRHLASVYADHPDYDATWEP